MLATLLLLDTVAKDDGNWITFNGRHIFIGSKEGSAASKKAWGAGKTAKTQSQVFAASNLHYAAAKTLYSDAQKFKGKEKQSLESQAQQHQNEGTNLQGKALSMKSTGPKENDPMDAKISNLTKPEDRKLMTIAQTAGEKLYGKDVGSKNSSGVKLDKTQVNRGSVKQYTGGNDEVGDKGEALYDTWDYVFKPSTGKAIDVADDPIRASHADVDGKIYVAGGGGVFVINSTKGLPK